MLIAWITAVAIRPLFQLARGVTHEGFRWRRSCDLSDCATGLMSSDQRKLV